MAGGDGRRPKKNGREKVEKVSPRPSDEEVSSSAQALQELWDQGWIDGINMK